MALGNLPAYIFLLNEHFQRAIQQKARQHFPFLFFDFVFNPDKGKIVYFSKLTFVIKMNALQRPAMK